MGPTAVQLYDNWTNLTEEQRKNPDDIWSAFESYFQPKTNYRLARFQLRSITQQVNVPIDTYVHRLKQQAQKCKFNDNETIDDNIIDQVIKGTCHTPVRKQLLDHDPSKLTLDKVLDCARTFEARQTQLQQLGASGNASIDNIRKKGEQSQHSCGHCGGHKHRRNECPANNKISGKCRKPGHFAKVCRSTQLKYHVSRTNYAPHNPQRGNSVSRGRS